MFNPNFRSTWIGLLSVSLLSFAISLPVTGQKRLVNTIKLNKRELLGAALQLENGDVALYISKPKENTVRVLVLNADGKLRWEKSITKMQNIFFKDNNSAGLGNLLNGTPVEDYYPTLDPLEVFASGNTLYAAEVVDKDLYQNDKKDKVDLHNILLQRLDSTGKIQRQVLTYADIPQATAVSSYLSYFENNAFYQISRERNTRKDTDDFFLNSFNSSGKNILHVRLPLARPLNNSKWTPEFIEDWHTLARYKGISYFYRRYKSTQGATAERFVEQRFELLGIDNQGQVAARIQPELDLGPYRIVDKNAQEPAFYIDQANDNIVFCGVYQKTTKNKLLTNPTTEGFYLEKYDLRGTLISHKQVTYEEALSDKYKTFAKQLLGSDNVTIIPDNITKNIAAEVKTSEGYITMYFDQNLKFEKSTFITTKDHKKLPKYTWNQYKLAPTFKNLSYNQRVPYFQGLSYYGLTQKDPMMGETLPIYYFKGSSPLYSTLAANLSKEHENNHIRYYVGRPTSNGTSLLLDYTNQNDGVINIYTVR
ncbi:hypothetical protein [Hymenobacter chitinivorans]|uniref:Uncharacterized protein n=1 Tax=Hymenobacter chitinivorans DSM 11115 TaxID=1121954 RepID=A0A2M9BS40_9BACT|nr:hypothetical protein [Hymenobacter chitinivorans]PJJ60758.1 hypothetical protein CLV45_2189 [Hymenobacter chitinivorans DSM 11115]